MAEIILHHYDFSPFSEKIRLIFGLKGLNWLSVKIPVILPRPDLMPLTGGYRRTPVMQIGADVFCDTQLIAAELERRFPEPSLYPNNDVGTQTGLLFWADRAVFQAAVGLAFSKSDEIDPAFVKDRENLSGQTGIFEQMETMLPHLREQFRAHCDLIEQQFADGRRFIVGDQPSLADFTAYHPLWLTDLGDFTATDFFQPFPALSAWRERVAAMGHGTSQEIEGTDALDIAANSTPESGGGVDPTEPNGLESGQPVKVMSDDFGRDPVEGELVASSAQRLTLRRTVKGLGEIHVHFPRLGYMVVPA